MDNQRYGRVSYERLLARLVEVKRCSVWLGLFLSLTTCLEPR